jgi:hypothetical protein
MPHPLDLSFKTCRRQLTGASAWSAAVAAEQDISALCIPMRSSRRRSVDGGAVRERQHRQRSQRVVELAIASVMLAIAAANAAAQAANPQPYSGRSTCTGELVQALPPGVKTFEDIAVDVSASRSSAVTRASDAAAELAVVDRAASEQAGLRIVAFGASGVGARVVFQGSFVPNSHDEVFNLVQLNRETCLARKAIARLARIAVNTSGGTDVAGALATEISTVKSLVKAGGTASVTVLTDGCQSPAARGPNHRLTNLCGQLTKGKTSATILRAHAAEFDIGDAREVGVVMRGIGVGRNPRFANTLFARKLVGFWTLVCRRAYARACLIESAAL